MVHTSSCRARDHPRIRGEHCQAILHVSSLAGSSPHTRGAPQLWRRPSCRPGIIPAYAGSTSKSNPRTPPEKDHPRIRGEHLPGSSWTALRCGSSPHTRGAHQRAPVWVRHQGIIPAYAGSTWRRTGRRRRCRDHPRIRGEHTDYAAEISEWKGSSPHTRGAPSWRRLVAERCGIIPAYAGSTVPIALMATAFADHPRIRGEHALRASSQGTLLGSSPHTRGARRLLRRGRRRQGIIPAYAGSTSKNRAPTPPAKDHPRIRGEHAWPALASAVSVGSSPHTRGAPANRMGSHQNGRIIPAYAGSTL